MHIEIKEIDHGWDELRKQMAAAAGESYAKAGIVGVKAEASHKDTDNGKGAPLNNAELAMVHEFGLGVPERSFIRAGFDKERSKLLSKFEILVGAIYDGKITVGRALTMLGMQCVTAIRKTITDGAGVPPPNAPATIARKGSSRPLVDTAQMKNALSYEVVLKGSLTKE